MSAQSASMKKQIKQFAKNLKNKVDIAENSEKLYQLQGPLDLYEKYEIRSLAKQYVADPIFSAKAAKLRTFLKNMKKQRKQEEKKSDAENVKENRKRQNSTTMENEAKKACVPVPCEKLEPKQAEMKKSTILKEKNGESSTSTVINNSEEMFQRRKNETKIYSGKRRTSEENSQVSHFTEPSQILRKCDGIPFHQIRPAFQQCTSNEKLKFIKMNLGFVNEIEEVFKDMTISEFPGITKLPNQFQHWYRFYEALTKMHRNEEVSKLEELTARIAENRRKARNVRKTKVIDAVHVGTSRRPTLVAQRPTTSRST